MKALMFVTALVAGLSLVASSAEAAKKHRRAPAPHAAYVTPDPYVVRDHDGEVLGRDPDPFIRLMILKDGKIRDQVGR